MVSLKKARNLPVHHPARKENMISERRSRGSEMGLDPDYLEELFRAIMRRSRVEQTESISRKGNPARFSCPDRRRDQWHGAIFSQLVHQVGLHYAINGERRLDNIASLCSGIDLALISVPIDSPICYQKNFRLSSLRMCPLPT